MSHRSSDGSIEDATRQSFKENLYLRLSKVKMEEGVGVGGSGIGQKKTGGEEKTLTGRSLRSLY